MATGLSCHDWLGGREAQSIAFFSTAVSEKLYSGLAISTPSASAISARRLLSGSGMPASNTSWLNIGRSAMLVMRRLMPCGRSSLQARSAAMLREAFLRLPQIPRICMARSLAALGQVRDHRFEPARIAMQGPELLQCLLAGLPPAIDYARLGLVLMRKLQADAIRVVKVHRPGIAADVQRTQVGQACSFQPGEDVLESLLRDRK